MTLFFRFVMLLILVFNNVFAEERISIKRGEYIVPVSLFNTIISVEEKEEAHAIFYVIENVYKSNGGLIFKKNSLLMTELFFESTCNRSKIKGIVSSFDGKKYPSKIYSGDLYENIKTVYIDSYSKQKVCGDFSNGFSSDAKKLIKEKLKMANFKEMKESDVDDENLLRIKRINHGSKKVVSYIPKNSVYILKMKIKD